MNSPAHKQYNSYATGKKIYSNGSNAPTRGTVNPKGYVQREMANKVQNRSGLAKAALNRVAANKPGLPPRGPAPVGVHAPAKFHPSPVKISAGAHSNLLKKPLSTAKAAIGKVKKAAPKPAAGPKPVSTADPAGAFGNPPVSMQVSPNGQLDLPYDENFAWDMLGATNDANDNLLQLQLQQQQQALEYGSQKRDAGLQYGELKRDTLNRDAARGMAFSSGYGKHVADNATQYNNFMGDLDQQNSQFNNGVNLQRTQIQNALSNMMRMGALQQAQGLEDQAGDLGYGQSSAAPTYQMPVVTPTGMKPGKKPHHNTGKPIRTDTHPGNTTGYKPPSTKPKPAPHKSSGASKGKGTAGKPRGRK